MNKTRLPRRKTGIGGWWKKHKMDSPVYMEDDDDSEYLVELQRCFDRCIGDTLRENGISNFSYTFRRVETLEPLPPPRTPCLPECKCDGKTAVPCNPPYEKDKYSEEEKARYVFPDMELPQ